MAKLFLKIPKEKKISKSEQSQFMSISEMFNDLKKKKEIRLKKSRETLRSLSSIPIENLQIEKLQTKEIEIESKIAEIYEDEKIAENNRFLKELEKEKRKEWNKRYQSKEWIEFRNKYIKDKCETCGTTELLSLHHTTYEYGLFDEDSIKTLCKKCHYKTHEIWNIGE